MTRRHAEYSRPLTVPDVLAWAHHPLGSKGRTSCPLHAGNNRQAFSFTEMGWYCFSGCGGGGAKELGERLGMDIPERREPHPLLGICVNDDLDVKRPKRVTQLLTELVAAREGRREDWAALRHRRAWQLLGWVDRYLALGKAHPEAQETANARITGFWIKAQMLLDEAHGAWGHWPWPCGCYEGA